MGKTTEERLKELEQEAAGLAKRQEELRARLADKALGGGWDRECSALAREVNEVLERQKAVHQALEEVRGRLAREREEEGEKRRKEREALGKAFDGRNRETATEFAALLLLALETLEAWDGLRRQAVAEADRWPDPLDLRPKQAWGKALEEVLRPLVLLLADVTGLPQDRGREHQWRAEALAGVAENLKGDLRALAERAAQRERAEAARLRFGDKERRSLIQTLAGPFKDGVRPWGGNPLDR